MNTLSKDALVAAQGTDVVDAQGEKIGEVEDIYYDETSDDAVWIGVGTGIFGLKRRVVPVEGARLEADCLRVPYEKEMVKDSPEVDDEEIPAAQEASLYAYYGVTSSAGRAIDARPDEARPIERETGAAGPAEGRSRLRRWIADELGQSPDEPGSGQRP